MPYTAFLIVDRLTLCHPYCYAMPVRTLARLLRWSFVNVVRKVGTLYSPAYVFSHFCRLFGFLHNQATEVVTVEYLLNTLTPVLHTHFTPKVDC